MAVVYKYFTSNIPGGGSMGYILKMQKYIELRYGLLRGGRI